MPNYRYTGRNASGALEKGNLVGPNEEAVVEQLLGRNIQPLQVEEVKAPGGLGAEVKLGFGDPWPNDDDVILFTRQMYALSKSGVSLVRSFQGLVESTHNKRLTAAMTQMIEDLQAGRDLSAAMAEHPKIFGQLYLRIVRMGEETGRMDESFQQMFKYMEIEKETRKQIKSALRYPSFVIMAIIGAMLVVNLKVIPAFEKVFDQFKSDLPIFTKILLGTSKFTQDYAIYIFVGLALTGFGIVKFINSKNGRMWFDRYKLTMPLVGTIINRATLSRYSRAFAMGSRSGLPVLQILQAVSEAVDNVYVAGKIMEMRDGIERGEGMTQAAFASGMFTPLVLQMMSVGEETGQMDEMMQEVAEFYEREVEYDVKNLTQAIEPILLLVVGAMVLVLALGIFMPMWNLGSAAMHK
ncbi:MAG: type II secretion system F family protein [Magnetococcales bacterium]|nr:type II secretion system F family protein [Magnetococcales bacterium]